MKELFEKVFNIEETDLPTEEDNYFVVHGNGDMDILGTINMEQWQTVRWYLRPLSIITDEEIEQMFPISEYNATDDNIANRNKRIGARTYKNYITDEKRKID